ncbi:MAG: DUF2275 domain-containing protein [Deltaproteobacteria bacterium]|nr:DUF2275 domain-containing protein [Deltaproteobacteria bacterium]
MTCNEIENLLPAYREELLSPEERSIVSGHLTSCPRCSRALADLTKVEALVQGLPEVDPPPFFEQRIMSRVRQEAGSKKGILRRLFFPLHIKIPIQAMATVLIAVLAFHVYQGGDPEMKQMAPLPAPLTDPGKSQVAVEAPGSPPPPSIAAPVKRVPEGGKDLPEKDRQRFVVPPPGAAAKEESAADSRATTGEARPSAMKPSGALMSVREKEVAQAGEETLQGMQDKAGKRDADKALESHPAEQKRKAGMSDTGAGIGESAKATSAPSPLRMTAVAPLKRQPVIGLTIRVGDSGIAVREIEARLGRVGARIIERQDRKGGEFLKVEIAAQNVAALLESLEAIGRVNRETHPPVDPDRDVTISIKIVAHP